MSDEQQWRFKKRTDGGWTVYGYGYSTELESFLDCVRFIRKYASAIEKQYKLKKGKPNV